MVLLQWAVMILVFLAAGVILWYMVCQLQSAIAGAPYINASAKKAVSMIEFADIKHGDRVWDLGCGSGQLLYAAARVQARVTGVEINSWAAIQARWRLRHCKTAGVILGSMWRYSVHDADVVLVYLLPALVARLEQKLLSELKPGARVISRGFPFPYLQLVKKQDDLYLYIIPLKGQS